MSGNYNNTFGEWLKSKMDEHGLKSSRNVRPRTGVSHTTIDDILAGTRPSVETAIKIARGFNESIPAVLLLAGYDDIVEAWDNPHSLTIKEQSSDYTVYPEWLGYAGKLLATLPEKEQEQLKAKLRQDAEFYTKMVLEKIVED